MSKRDKRLKFLSHWQPGSNDQTVWFKDVRPVFCSFCSLLVPNLWLMSVEVLPFSALMYCGWVLYHFKTYTTASYVFISNYLPAHCFFFFIREWCIREQVESAFYFSTIKNKKEENPVPTLIEHLSNLNFCHWTTGKPCLFPLGWLPRANLHVLQTVYIQCILLLLFFYESILFIEKKMKK